MPQHRYLSVIQRCYDLIAWFIPCLERLPRSHKYTLGERLQHGLYDLLGVLVQARYSAEKEAALERANARLEVLRYQVRLGISVESASPDAEVAACARATFTSSATRHLYRAHLHAPPHLFRAGATYFITARNLDGAAVMQPPNRRGELLSALRFACEKESWRLLAWVVLTNHYHCILKAPRLRA